MNLVVRNTWAMASVIVSAVIMATVMAGCGCSSSDSAEEGLTRIKREGVLRIGYANEAPFAYLDETSGEVTGEAPEIAKHIAVKMGVKKVEGVLTEFGALIPGLKAGRFDVIAAGMYIRPERAEQVLFTSPTYGLGEGFLVASGNPLKLHSYQDVVDNAEVRFGVVSGTAELKYAEALGITKDRVVVFPDNTAALAGLVADRVDAVGMTALTCADLDSKKGDRAVEKADPFTDPDIDGAQVRSYGAFAVKIGDEALRDAFNAELKAFLGTPEHAALVKPFGFGPDESAKGKTLADVLAGFGSK